MNVERIGLCRRHRPGLRQDPQEVAPRVERAPFVTRVRDDDTAESLSERILEQEHRIYPEAIGLVLAGAWAIDGRTVRPTSQT